MKKNTSKRRGQATRRKPARKPFSWSSFSLSNLRISFPWKTVNIFTFVVLPAVLLIGTYRWINHPENMTIKTVEVTGDLKVLDKELLQPVIEPYAKTNLYLLDAKGLEQKIQENPWVHSASLTRVWPDKLIVKIHEQKPVAFWGKDAMLSQQGEIIKAVLPKKKGVLPLLYSPENKGRNMASGFLQIREWMEDFPLKMVEFKEDARGSWQIKFENGLVVKMGRQQHKKRMRRFMVGYREKLGEVVNKIHTVDLRYTNGFAVKWKQGQSG